MQDGDRLEPLDMPPAAGILDANMAGYLSAATNIQQLDEAVVNGAPYGRYAFDIDAGRMALLLRDAQATLRDDLPPGVTLQLPAAFSNMQGDGEVWLDGEGRPRRQEMDLFFPALDPQYDVRLQVRIDYFEYDEPVTLPQIGIAPDGTPNLFGVDGVPPLPAFVAQTAPPGAYDRHLLAGRIVVPRVDGLHIFTAAVFALLLLSTVLYIRHPRTVYRVTSGVLAFSFLATPLLQPAAQAATNAHNVSR